MITQSINLNLIPGGVLPRINVSQYDKGSRTLQFVLFNGPVLYSIESGTEITIQGSKPDNTAFQYDCTWSGSTVSMDIEQQMTAVAGDVICELVISNDGEILGTCNFILNVESAAVSDDTVISETELPLIERAVEAAVEAAASAASAAQSATDASGYVDTVQTAAQNAAQSATAASSSAGTAQTAAQNAAQSATDASSSAGTAQTAAQNAAQSATDASSSAGTAQTAAQNAAQSATDASGSASSASQSATNAAASAQAAAQSAASIGIATTSQAGIVKPDGTTITVDQDGTIHGNASVTVDSALSSTSVNPVQNKVITAALGKVEEIIAPVETDPATNAWAVGRQIIYNDNLYEVITAITAGDALVAYEDDPTNANIKLADPVETQLLNLKGNVSNRNLLDNAWFTVNQRSSTNFPSSAWSFWIDRWKTLVASGEIGRTITLDNGIHITSDTISTVKDVIYQVLEPERFVFGKTYTLSYMLADGTINSVSGVISVPDGTYKIYFSKAADGIFIRVNSETNGNISVVISARKDNSDLTLRAVKLELGSVATLAMDTAPNYAEELLKCQRYFYRYKANDAYGYMGMGGIQSTTNLRFILNLPTTMRAAPTISYSGSFNIADFGASNISTNITNITSQAFHGNSIVIIVRSSDTLTAATPAILKANNDADAYIDFSADL